MFQPKPPAVGRGEGDIAKEENTKNEETFAAPTRNVLKEKIRLNIHQKNKDKTKEKKKTKSRTG